MPNLKVLFNEVITEPLNNHVALSTRHWLVIYTNNQSQICFLDSNTTRTLEEQPDQQTYRKLSLVTKGHSSERLTET